jgi:hypothetical protein
MTLADGGPDAAIPAGHACAAAILARLDRLPSTGHVWLLITLLSLGGMFEFYELRRPNVRRIRSCAIAAWSEKWTIRDLVASFTWASCAPCARRPRSGTLAGTGVGGHTDEFMTGLLGLRPDDIAAPRAEGVL